MRQKIWMLGIWLVGTTLSAASDPLWLTRGEKLTYALSYLHVVAGTLELVAEPEGENLRLTMTATSTPAFSRIFPVNNRVVSVLARQPLTLIQQEAFIAEGKRRYVEVVTVHTERGMATRLRDGKERGQIKVQPPVLDTLGALFALRGLDLAPGRAFALDVLSGKEVYPLAVVVTGRQSLKVGGEKVPTFVVEPRFRQGGLYKGESKLLLYVTQDGRHTPVRIVSQLPFGALTATLVGADPPWQEVVN
ncbi:MAG: DUF3108 domain-containing protein [Thermoanaerobaculum sp.]|nr:DUF3108 domain-containing protein [Thermoanaerobaculum sp.]MDW7968404.1 DUF3108 domain-containing protein [Thermoanaerobaculum sp.]